MTPAPGLYKGQSYYGQGEQILFGQKGQSRVAFPTRGMQPWIGTCNVMLCYEDNYLHSYISPWITVQENRYRYCVSPNSNIVKFVIAEYLAVEVHVELTL